MADKQKVRLGQNKKLVKKLLIISGWLALVGFFTYSLIEYRRSGIVEVGVVTCAKGQCFWGAHIHVYTPIQICGEKYVLPKFKGPLNGLHTHGEENIVHWHDKIAFDAEKKQFSEPTPFALNFIFRTLELPVSNESMLGKKDGDTCRELTSAWKVFVNGVFRPDWRNYEWEDRDIALYVFDERTAEEVEKELRQKPIKFPRLGEG